MLPVEPAAPTDESLLARYVAGEVAAFEQLYARHERASWRYFLRQCHNPANAEELMQDVWFTVCREAPTFRDGARFAPWFYSIARHRVIDRHRTTHTHQSLDATGAEEEVPLVERLADGRSVLPDSASEQDEMATAILLALEQLPIEQREAFVMQADAGLSVEDIALVTGASFETVKSRLRYARDKLRSLLQEHRP
jgi:RNA polymerase sigma-70 factor (ECF subfamily)